MVRAVLLILLVAGCDDECPRGSMLDSAEGLVVTVEEHPTGWGQASCASCHAFEALHRIGCTEEVDLAEVRAEVRDEGRASCTSCHGDNGVMR